MKKHIWKRTVIKLWRLRKPARPFFQRHFDGEETFYYFGSIAVSFEHWYEKRLKEKA